MKVKFYGHACFGIEIEGKDVLFDPFISPNELAAHIDINDISADYILISHGHEDHVADVETIAKRTDAIIVSNFEIVSWYGAKGLVNGHPMNIGGAKTFDFGNVKSVNALHSSVLPDGTYGGNPGGFVVSSNEANFYYAGDTALTLDMKMIGDYSNLDFAILPIGDNFTMGVDDAIRCSDFIKCDKIIAMHYNTFPYIAIDVDAAKEKFAQVGKELIVIEIGSTIEI